MPGLSSLAPRTVGSGLRGIRLCATCLALSVASIAVFAPLTAPARSSPGRYLGCCRCRQTGQRFHGAIGPPPYGIFTISPCRAGHRPVGRRTPSAKGCRRQFGGQHPSGRSAVAVIGATASSTIGGLIAGPPSGPPSSATYGGARKARAAVWRPTSAGSACRLQRGRGGDPSAAC